MADAPKKKKVNYANAWVEARVLMLQYRPQLIIGLALMLVNRAAGLVLPASTKWLIDDVFTKGRADLLWKIAVAIGVATLVQAITSFALSLVVSLAGQRAITEMRRRVPAPDGLKSRR